MRGVVNPTPNYYWSGAVQYQGQQGQQRQQVQGQRGQPSKRQQQQQKIQVKEGFDPELMDKDVEIEEVKGPNVVVMRGRVVDVSKYWFKVLVNGEIVYVNKAFVISIRPVMIKNGMGGGNAGEQSSKRK